jgi:hypothetical protein
MALICAKSSSSSIFYSVARSSTLLHCKCCLLLVVDVDVVVVRVVADHLNYIPPVDELTLPRPDRMSMRIVASAAIEEDPSMRAI